MRRGTAGGQAWPWRTQGRLAPIRYGARPGRPVCEQQVGFAGAGRAEAADGAHEELERLMIDVTSSRTHKSWPRMRWRRKRRRRKGRAGEGEAKMD